MAARYPVPCCIPPGLRVVQLPYPVFEQISFLIDSSMSTFQNAFMTLGSYLGYSVPQCRLFERRCANWACNFSPTQVMLEDFAERGGTVLRLQNALLRVGLDHAAARVIPGYLTQLPQLSGGLIGADGEQHIESTNCGCPTCWRAQILSHNSTGAQNISPPISPQDQHVPNFTPREDQPASISPSITAGPSNIEQQAGHGSLPNGQISRSRVSPGDSRHQCEPPQQNTRFFPTSNRRGNPDIRREPAIGSSTPSLRDTEQAPPPPVYNGQIRLSPVDSAPSPSRSRDTGCVCDKCRLASDPDQTEVLTTITSTPRYPCQLLNNLTNNLAQTRLSNAGPSSSNGNSNVSSNSDNIGACGGLPKVSVGGGEEQARQSKSNSKKKGDVEPLCIKSTDNNTHKLGEQPNTCSVCKAHREEKRNTWPSDIRDKSFQLNRNSSSSDGSISQHGSNSRTNSSDIANAYPSVSFTNPLNPRTGSGPTGQAGDLDTNELNDRLQSLNNRNNSGWNGSRVETSRENGRRPEREPEGAIGGGRTVRRNTDFVFVTFSWNPHDDDQQHLHEIIQLCRELVAAGIRVKIDMDPEVFDTLRLNRQDWLDQMTREARYVIVCISPTYFADTQDHSDSAPALPQPAIAQLNARYIFNNLREEFHRNGARNRRLIPIMFTNSGASAEHIPLCMRSTLVYNYPGDTQDIIQASLGERGADYRLPYRH